MGKSVNELKLPSEVPHISREDAWTEALQHKGLVIKAINQYAASVELSPIRSNFGYDEIRAELEGAAWEGCLKAVETFDGERKLQFSTYAYTVMWNEMSRAIRMLFAQKGGSRTNNDSVDVISLEGTVKDNDVDEYIMSVNKGAVEPDFAEALIQTLYTKEAIKAAKVIVRAEMDNPRRQTMYFWLEGYTPAQLAEWRGVTVQAIHKLIGDGKEYLAKRLKEKGYS